MLHQVKSFIIILIYKYYSSFLTIQNLKYQIFHDFVSNGDSSVDLEKYLNSQPYLYESSNRDYRGPLMFINLTFNLSLFFAGWLLGCLFACFCVLLAS